MRQATPPDPALAAPARPRTTPYQGLQPYAEGDAPFFFGRDAERAILAANLMAAKLTLVYGASGVGKSSVLRAGVVHQLREQEAQADHTAGTPRLVVVYVNEWSGDPVARLQDRVGQEVARVLGEPGPPEPEPSEGLAGTLAAWTARRHLELLVILDQFEEYFLYHRDEDGPGSFAAEFPPAIDRPDLPVSFLVAIREDALARLDRFKGRIPNLFETYVRIRHLSVSQAEAAIWSRSGGTTSCFPTRSRGRPSRSWSAGCWRGSGSAGWCWRWSGGAGPPERPAASRTRRSRPRTSRWC